MRLAGGVTIAGEANDEAKEHSIEVFCLPQRVSRCWLSNENTTHIPDVALNHKITLRLSHASPSPQRDERNSISPLAFIYVSIRLECRQSGQGLGVRIIPQVLAKLRVPCMLCGYGLAQFPMIRVASTPI